MTIRSTSGIVVSVSQTVSGLWPEILVNAHQVRPAVRASMDDELIYQTFLNRSDDFAEFRAARSEERPGNYTGS